MATSVYNGISSLLDDAARNALPSAMLEEPAAELAWSSETGNVTSPSCGCSAFATDDT